MKNRNVLVDLLLVIVLALCVVIQVSEIVQRTEINRLKKQNIKLEIQKLKLELGE